ncbi:ankyrin repeat-containing domain protein [Dactylonectria estremocensis]|uniref:Ankyrin repeat-containing domain protein n=1 Tax=Dactylonectria estremocensis TaxID=1079267 RepID=A0A9P9DZJ9_9HYPO|nr:ankyrin repeat-containing domain protein [Dactylonectria estremocensis]
MRHKYRTRLLKSPTGDQVVLDLIEAVRNRSLGIVQFLLADSSVDVNLKDETGHTPLSWAARTRRPLVVQALLKVEGICADEKDDEGLTPLSWAAGWRGFKVELTREFGKRHRRVSEGTGHIRIVESLLARVDVDVNSQDDEGWTPLWWAASARNLNAMRCLLKRDDIDVNSRDSCGRTILSRAVETELLSVVNLLLDKDDVDINAKDDKGRTLLSLVSQKDDWEMVDSLLRREDIIDINATDQVGRTPLLWASLAGHLRIVERLLLAEHIDPDVKDENHQTPLSIAAELGHANVARALALRKTVDIDSKDLHGRTPLSWAAGQGHFAIVDHLLRDRDADANSRDNNGRTPMWWAAEKGHLKVVTILESYDKTTLHSLISEGNQPAVCVVLSAGYDINKLDSRKQTPLHVAVRNNRVNLAKMLISHQASLDVKDNLDMTPLSLALQNHGQDLVKLLLKSSASSADINVSGWFAGYRQSSILCLTGTKEGWRCVQYDDNIIIRDVLPKPLIPSDGEKRLFLFKDSSAWKRSLGSISGDAPQSYKIQTSPSRFVLERSWYESIHFSASLSMPQEPPRSYRKTFRMPYLGEIRVMWSIRPSKDDLGWKAVDLLSTLQDSSVPSDATELYTQFIFAVEAMWLKLCDRAEDHVSQCRLDQLREKGQSAELIHRLAEDAQKWLDLRLMLRDHIQAADELAILYFRHFNGGDGLNQVQSALQRLEVQVNRRLNTLDQITRDLVQLEFTWVAVREANKSTSIAKSIRRIRWITFIFLPAMFASNFFGVNITFLKENPEWRWYILIGGAVLVLTVFGWLTFKHNRIWSQSLEASYLKLNKQFKVSKLGLSKEEWLH